MKLYDVPRNSKVRILNTDTTIPPESQAIAQNEILRFSHVDGMYSYCLTKKDRVVYPAAWTEVEIVQ